MSFVFRHRSWGFTPGYGNCRLSACTEHAESVPYHIAQGNALGQSTQRRMHTLKGCHLMLATAITTICRGYATEVDTPVILLRLLIRSHIFIFKPIFDSYGDKIIGNLQIIKEIMGFNFLKVKMCWHYFSGKVF